MINLDVILKIIGNLREVMKDEMEGIKNEIQQTRKDQKTYMEEINKTNLRFLHCKFLACENYFVADRSVVVDKYCLSKYASVFLVYFGFLI